MKRNPLFVLNLFFFLFLSIGFFNCTHESAVADFNPNTAIRIECGECVVFEDISRGDIHEVLWEFEGGNPATSEDFQVTVCYGDPGKYDVSLSVNPNASIGGDRDQNHKKDIICVEAKNTPLVASFLAESTEIIQGQSIFLIDQTTGSPESWSWVVEGPGGSFTSIEQNPQFQLNTPGTYSVTLTVENVGDQDVLEKIGYIKVLEFFAFDCRIESSNSNIGLSSTHEYNSQGQLIRSDEFLNGSLSNYSMYTWGNNDLLVRAERFNRNQTRIERQEFSYNNQGVMSSQEILDSSGVSLGKYDFTINNGLITGGTLETPLPQGGFFKSGLEYKYGAEENNVIEERIFDLNNGNTFQRIELEFDNFIRPFFELKVELFPARHFMNNPIVTRVIDASNVVSIEQIHQYEYNEFGRAIKEFRESFGITNEFAWEYTCERN